MDDAAWAALTLSLTVLGGIWTWFAFRRRGAAAGLRGLSLTLLPLAAYLTDTLQMFTGIVTEVGDWAAGLAFSPTVWLGIALGGLSALLFVVSGRLLARRRGQVPGKPEQSTPAVAGRKQPAIAEDGDMADIEALLRKRGIS